MNHASSNKLAEWIDRTLHPGAAAGLAVFVVMYLSGVGFLQTVGWVSLMIVVLVLPLLLLRTYNKRRKAETVTQDSHSEYILAAACTVALLILLNVLGAPDVYLATIYSVILAVCVSALINRYITKISRHMIVFAGSATLVFIVSPALGVAVIAAALLVGWSRVHLRYHTLSQIILGAMVAIGSTWLVFSAYL